MQRRRQSHPSRQIVRLSSQEFSLSGASRRAPTGQRGGRMVGAASAAWPKAASARRHLPGAAPGRLAARSFPRLPARAAKKRSRKNCREPRQLSGVLAKGLLLLAASASQHGAELDPAQASPPGRPSALPRWQCRSAWAGTGWVQSV